LKGAKMEVNGSGGRLDRKNFKREIRKKKKPQRKRNIAGSVKPGKPHARKYDFICSARLVRSGG
uniref:hypothetical protein n=1 Tax=Bacteroides clarus TaxID=626929 RepID=UPI003FEDC0C7